jgi:hypothetical protein
MDKELFDLDINKKMETPTEMTAQTWTSILKVSRAPFVNQELVFVLLHALIVNKTGNLIN